MHSTRERSCQQSPVHSIRCFPGFILELAAYGAGAAASPFAAAKVVSFVVKLADVTVEKCRVPISLIIRLRPFKIDALCLSDGDYLWDGRNNINSTLYYLSTPTSMITRYDTREQRVVALVKAISFQKSSAATILTVRY